MATKKKQQATVRRNEDDAITIAGVKQASELKPKTAKKPSKYAQILELAKRLRPGEVLEVEVADGENIEEVRTRISAAVRRRAQPKTAHKLKIRMTERGSVGIYCYESRE
jgi:hypothetical protein